MQRFPLLRVAFALTNLTSDRVEDGVSRLLAKTDFTKFSTKSAAPDVMIYENILQDVFDIVDKLASRETAMKTLGQFLVRIV